MTETPLTTHRALFGSSDGLNYDGPICQACGALVGTSPHYRAIHAAWHLRIIALEAKTKHR